MRRFILLIAVVFSVIVAAPAFAVNNCTGNACVDELKSTETTITKQQAEDHGIKSVAPTNVLTGVLNGVYAITAVIAVIVIVTAGVMYVTSDGDPSRTTRAKNAIIYSAVGLVIVGSAFIITGIIQYIGSS